MEITDEKLIDELKKRLDEKNRALNDLMATTRNLEKVNKKLQESEKLKTDFLSNIRNEINNPLTILVALSAELATMKDSDKEKYRGITRMLHKEALSLDFQMRNILTVADLEAGESYLHITKVNINSLIDGCINNLTPMMDENSIDLKKEGPSPLWVNTDSGKLTMIILNLISNGIVFNREGGNLKISFDATESEFTCSVQDEGIGIKEEDKNVVFDRFRQLDSGMKKKFRGHGLGLSVAKALVDIMEGSISIESTPGKGSAFTLRVPFLTEMEAEGVSTEGVEFFGDNEKEF